MGILESLWSCGIKKAYNHSCKDMASVEMPAKSKLEIVCNKTL
jgi:hypothetical protein